MRSAIRHLLIINFAGNKNTTADLHLAHTSILYRAAHQDNTQYLIEERAEEKTLAERLPYSAVQ
jgi:hypothetical protein